MSGSVDEAREVEGVSVFQILPRGMQFNVENATSIDLCVAELVKHSAFADRTTIFAEATGTPLLGNVKRFTARSTRARIAEVVEAVHRDRPNAIVVQQHLPSAAGIAKALPEFPVFFHAHNFQKRSKTKIGVVRRISDAVRARRYGRLAGLIFVSDAVRSKFESDFDVIVPRIVIPNSFEPGEWEPRSERADEIVVIGRLSPEKGVLDAAEAVTAVLAQRPDWRATFILSETKVHRDYAERTLKILGSLPDQITVLTDVPHRVVREANARAAVAIVPSKWNEPFGRTALEAHAGGAALISSGTGGLREVSGDAALFLERVDADTIRTALTRLLDDPAERLRLGRSGADRARALFSAEAVAARLDAFIASISAR